MASKESTPLVGRVVYDGPERRRVAAALPPATIERRASGRRVTRLLHELEANAPVWFRLGKR